MRRRALLAAYVITDRATDCPIDPPFHSIFFFFLSTLFKTSSHGSHATDVVSLLVVVLLCFRLRILNACAPPAASFPYLSGFCRTRTNEPPHSLSLTLSSNAPWSHNLSLDVTL
ncbi:hypothetical protein DM02DRAFT_225385 [Periconia macrospinosa]|uniref:Uncharacterized protein n=1 Tax=Periconia macrospinosa TaxID=97972 RepID=A0A2V1DZH0_9PLEO|nr:hypothetical protein DM02DRAFT_225385 [Periconia macrospinosa]